MYFACANRAIYRKNKCLRNFELRCKWELCLDGGQNLIRFGHEQIECGLSSVICHPVPASFACVADRDFVFSKFAFLASARKANLT